MLRNNTIVNQNVFFSKYRKISDVAFYGIVTIILNITFKSDILFELRLLIANQKSNVKKVNGCSLKEFTPVFFQIY